MTTWLLYLLTGSFAGVLAGLFGVGGGLVIVPILTFILTAQGQPTTHILHLALGTSLASILFTSLSSVRAHHGRGAVNWEAVKSITPGIMLGTLAGSWVAAKLSTDILKIIFVIFQYYVATQLLLDIKPKPHRQLPGNAGMFGVGSLIGGFSSLVGIGGGTISVPFLIWCNSATHTAIGTSAAIGFPIALAGTIGYVINGYSFALLQYSLGFVYLPALAGIVAASVLTAPLGARIAHSLPVSKLKKVFAILLLIIGTKMLMSLY